jgi:tRNA threonylcarbamoyl adenosine modification protein YeaZ
MANLNSSDYNLCVDTSAGTTVAVMQGGEVRSEINFDENMKHAERIGDAISQAIISAGIKPNQINNVIVGRGPAPFTGLRIGIAAAVMFAEGVGAKLYGVTSLDAIARAALTADKQEALPLLVTADARRSEVYWALYSGLTESGAPIMVEGPGVAKPAALEEMFASKPHQSTVLKISAQNLGRVFDAQQKDGSTAHEIGALYLREADAVAPKDLRDFGKKVSG